MSWPASFTETLEKLGWDVQLRPHQERVHAGLKSAPGKLVYHGLGSGKTITSITAADAEGKDAVVVVPAALRENYRKEIAKVNPKQKFEVMSYEKFSKDPSVAKGKVLIVDEGQRARNSATKRSQALRNSAKDAYKRLVLSGTPIQNAPEEIAPIINIVSGEDRLPVQSTFREKYVGERKVSPGFLARLRGVKPGTHYYMKNQRDFAQKTQGLVDYHPSATDDFPDMSTHVHDVDMSKRQRQVYQYVLKNAPLSMRLKMKAGLPPSKTEAKQLNAFLNAARIVSNTPQPYQNNMTPDEGFQHSPKMQRIVENIRAAKKADPKHKALVYSNYLEGGVHPLQKALEREGLSAGIFQGGMTDRSRRELVERFNKDQQDVLLVSGAGAEGLDLKGTRSVHILEPHWNKGRIEQVIGRARRFQSHHHLPEKDRHVAVHHYRSTLPRGFFQKILRKKRDKGADEYLTMLSEDKQKLIDQFHKALQANSSK